MCSKEYYQDTGVIYYVLKKCKTSGLMKPQEPFEVKHLQYSSAFN
jgi:hypothetical protein